MNKDYNFCGLATRSEVATGLFVSSPSDTQIQRTSGFPLLSLAD
ncbi:MAG: hypothetical protein ACKVOQ_17100 [Cyclobacteriaceae bacterium]